MKKLILIGLIAAGGWWYFVGGRTLTDEQVRTFYQDVERATLMREPERLCESLAEDFQSDDVASVGGRREKSSHNKTQTCDGYRDLYKSFDMIGTQMGGMVQLDSRYEIHSIQISPDGKNATADVSTSLDVAGSIMNIRWRSTDTLIRRNGKVLVLRSQGKGSISSGG
jgi:hypothetical protein